MYFLNPGAFWAFSLLLIPILIHLFNLRRVKKIYFSNLHFLKDVTQQQKSRSTLKKWLVLVSRLLILSFLILAFANPVVLDNDAEKGISNPVIYLDNSLSLERTDLSGNLLLINAISGTNVVLENYPKGIEVALLTNDQAYLKWEQVKSALERVQNVDYTSKPQQLEGITERIQQINGRKTMIFSDFQKSTSGSLDFLLKDTLTQYTLYKLYSPIEKNLYVDTVYLSEPLNLSSGNTLNVKITNTDTDPVSDVLIKIYRDSLQLASFTISIGTNADEELSLELGSNQQVSGNYSIEIEDSPVVFDNTFYFTINRIPKPRVVVLSDGPPNPYLSKVYANNNYFILEEDQIGSASYEKILSANLVILDQLDKIPEWFNSQFIEMTGNLLVIPSNEPDFASYSALMGFPVLQGLPNQSKISSKSLENPFFDGFFQQQNDQMSLPSVTVQYNVSGYYESLLNTLNNEPYLLRNGRKYLFTSSFENEGNNFPKHALFVPTMYKLAQNLDVEKLYDRLDESFITIKMDSSLSESILELKNNQNTFLPTTRLIDKNLLIEVPEVLKEPGIYYLLSGSDTIRSVAMNYSIIESQIETYSLSDLKKLTGGNENINVSEISDMQEFINTTASSNDREGLWKYALLLALTFIITETILLRFVS